MLPSQGILSHCALITQLLHLSVPQFPESPIVPKYPKRIKCYHWFCSSVAKSATNTGDLEGWWWYLVGCKYHLSSVFSREEARDPLRGS